MRARVGCMDRMAVRRERSEHWKGARRPCQKAPSVKLRFTEKTDKDYARMPPLLRKAFAKQLHCLLDNRNHPSLHAKKYSQAPTFSVRASPLRKSALPRI